MNKIKIPVIKDLIIRFLTSYFVVIILLMLTQAATKLFNYIGSYQFIINLTNQIHEAIEYIN